MFKKNSKKCLLGLVLITCIVFSSVTTAYASTTMEMTDPQAASTIMGETDPQAALTGMEEADPQDALDDMEETNPRDASAAIAAAYAKGVPAAIEETYSQEGSYTVTKKNVLGLYNDPLVIYYPKKLGTGKYPLITWGNGTFTNPSYYDELLTHIASYGFIIVCSYGDNQGSGVKMVNAAQFMINCNSNVFSTFYNHVDTGNIAAMGHSQGACGAVNVGSASIYGKEVKTVVSLSLVSAVNLAFLGSACNVVSIGNKPTLFICGDKEYTGYATIPVTTAYYNSRVWAGQPTAMAALTNAGHNECTDDYGKPERYFGYITSWLLYQLKGDKVAGGAFTGSNPELLTNNSWSNAAISKIK